MALSALRARMGVGASRMIVNAVGRTGNASRLSRTLKVVRDNTGNGGFGKIRRFSDIAEYRLPDKITADTTRFGEYCFALYLGGLLVPCGIMYGLSYIVSERRDRRERLRFPRYEDDIKHDDALQFDDKYIDAMDSQDQLVSQWRAADDRKLAQLEAEIAQLRGAVNRLDLRAEITKLREELLHAGTAAEVLEIRKGYDDLVEDIQDISRMSSQWRAVADLKLAEFKRKITEVRDGIQELERKQNVQEVNEAAFLKFMLFVLKHHMFR